MTWKSYAYLVLLVVALVAAFLLPAYSRLVSIEQAKRQSILEAPPIINHDQNTAH